MNYLIATIMIGSLALYGAQPSAAQTRPAAQQTTPVLPSGTTAHAVARDAATDRQSFTLKARDEVQAWQKTLADFNAGLAAKATTAQAKASKELESAWAETKAASDRLETAGEKDWTSAKTSFDTASHKLALAWHKFNPGAKS
jgi:hypothetical protein